jgi:threonine synthase
MEFISTRGESTAVPLREAVSKGLAPDGGLYMPGTVPKLDPGELKGLGTHNRVGVAQAVLRGLFQGALAPATVGSLTAAALDFPMPLVRLGERIHVLELFHGPTLAFKDVGARFMSCLLVHLRRDNDPVITVLTATSGDTGGAVAQALHGLPGIKLVILFPDGKVTPRQERQFSTLGGNVTTLAVQGDFDDCQRIAKQAFRNQIPGQPPLLTSANSINVGRFLPQTTYFFEAWSRLQREKGENSGILFSVPSGNFGNLAAGLLAKSMGLPGASFLAATNLNDVVPQYIRNGLYSPRPSTPTLSTAMDVGNPSNLDRILHLYGNDLAQLRQDVVGQRVTDSKTRACIRRVHRETGYVLDPHTAVGFAALEKELGKRPNHVGVVLATAHPAKFAEVVEPLIGETLPIPRELTRCLEGERKVIPLEPRLGALRGILDP